MAGIASKMDYAMRLADPEWHPQTEDIFKLASLIAEIAVAEDSGQSASESLTRRYRETIKSYFEFSGRFRAEVEHNATAKRYLSAI